MASGKVVLPSKSKVNNLNFRVHPEEEQCMVSVNEFLAGDAEDSDEADDATADVSQEIEGEMVDQFEDIADVMEFMSTREANILEELQNELEEKVSAFRHSEKGFKDQIKLREANLKDVKIQLDEAQKLEENLRRDLKKVTKDIEVLEKRNLEIRNEITTETRQHQHNKDNTEKKVRDCEEKLAQYVSDIKEKVKERRKESLESPEPLNRSSKYNSMVASFECLNIEAELECPICFELSRPPIYQCPEGHIICNTCRPRVSKCPVCRFVFQGMPDIRNRFIEKLATTYFSNEN